MGSQIKPAQSERKRSLSSLTQKGESLPDIASSLETSIAQATGPLSWSSNCWCCTQQPPWCFPPVRTTSRTWQTNKLFSFPISRPLISSLSQTTQYSRMMITQHILGFPKIEPNLPWIHVPDMQFHDLEHLPKHDVLAWRGPNTPSVLSNGFVCLVISSLESKIKNLNPPNYLLAIELATFSTKINSLKLFM